MKGTVFVESNAVLKAPSGEEENVYDLDIRRVEYEGGRRAVISCWEATWRERFMVLITGRVWFTSFGVTHPPIRLDGIRPMEIRK